MADLSHLLGFLSFCLSPSLVSSYPNGNMLPLSVCQDMKPRSAVGVMGMEGHLLLPQNKLPGTKSLPPFYIAIHQEKLDYTPGANIQVSVIANQTVGLMFYTGLLLQARRVVCASNSTVLGEDIALGSFTVPNNPRETLLDTMDCSGPASRSAVRHRTNAFKVNETFTWRAPDENVGNIVFKAVIIHQGDNYWSDIHSRILREPGHAEVAPPTCGGQELKGGLLSVSLTALFITSKKYLF